MPETTSKPAHPTVEQITALPVTQTTVIPEEFIDQYGHMNVRFHLQIGLGGFPRLYETDTEGTDERSDPLPGLGGLFTAEHHLRYHAEAKLGETVTTHARIIGHSDKVIHVMMLNVNRDTEQLSSTLEATLIHVDLDTRRPTPMPAEMATYLDRQIEQQETLGWDAPVCGAMGVRR